MSLAVSRPRTHESPLSELLGDRAPSFLFAGPSRTVCAHDEALPVHGRLRDRGALLDAARRALEDTSRTGQGVLVGAVPFADDMPVRMFCPTRVSMRGRWWLREREAEPGQPAQRLTRPSEGQGGTLFRKSVQAAVAAIERGELKKVVLSRMSEYALAEAADLRSLLCALRAKNPQGFVFALALCDGPDRKVHGARTLVGASPELLLSRRGAHVVSTPLAGTCARGTDDLEDRRRADRLLSSPKDRSEHRIVVEEIVDQLAPFMRDLRWERTPRVTATPTLLHLSTRIEGTLRTRDICALELALALHPTPAVCGTPKAQAAAFIREQEPFERGYFTGTLGYMDARGDGDYVVTIRCAELSATHARVYAGAGIVAGSDAAAELAETEAKMQTMLAVLSEGSRP